MMVWLRQHPWLKFLSFILTLMLFYFVNSLDVETVELDVPIMLDAVPDGWHLSEEPDDVRITVRGPRNTVANLEESGIPAHVIGPLVDGSSSWTMEPGDFALPPGVNVLAIVPAEVELKLEELVTLEVAVNLQVEGRPAAGHQVLNQSVTPASILVTAPASYFPELTSIDTEVVNISGRTESLDRTVELNPRRPYISLPSDVEATIHVEIGTVNDLRTVSSVPVTITGAFAQNCTLLDPTIRVTLEGPEVLLDDLNVSSLFFAVDCTSSREQGPGLYTVEPRLQNVPTGLTVSDQSLGLVRLRVDAEPEVVIEGSGDVAPLPAESSEE
jgi:YbbR domain-containing protein